MSEINPICNRCKIPMMKGEAIPPAIVEGVEGTKAEGAWVDSAPLVEVWKCPSCGHSFTVK